MTQFENPINPSPDRQPLPGWATPVIGHIRRTIVKPDLTYNQYQRIEPAARAYKRELAARGWTESPGPAGSKAATITAPSRSMRLRVGGMAVSRHPYITTRICRDKRLAGAFLSAKGVRQPQSASFTKSELPAATAFFTMIDGPAVLKPSHGAASVGVVTDITDEDDFANAFNELSATTADDHFIIVQSQFTGLEVRVLVAGNNAVAAAARLPAFVLGDGGSSLSDLIEADSSARKLNRRMKIDFSVDELLLLSQGLSLQSVPERGTVVLLSQFTIFGSGAIFQDITDDIDSSITALAVHAVSAIPNLEIAGVDIIVDNVEKPGDCAVLEVNTSPSYPIHRYPGFGEPRDIAQAVAEYYSGHARPEARRH